MLISLLVCAKYLYYVQKQYSIMLNTQGIFQKEKKFYFIYIYIITRVFYPRTGPSLQAQEPRLLFCQRQVFHHRLRNQGYSFTRDWIGGVAYRCYLHPTLFSASEQTLKDVKRSQGHQRGGEKSGFGYNWAL